MKNQELQVDTLKRQNRQMSIKMQIYRVENQELRAKNEQLNQWVGNLSEVFSTISASWESITILQETLLNLMKKKTEARDRTLLRKYQFHFKTFADIINNLSQKIKNQGHSDQATQNAKEQLRSFVKNYELIFKQMIETYFKFNQDYSQYLNSLQNREDVKQQFRALVVKSVENAQKNKEFEAYVESLKQNFTVFEEYNNNKLLEGVVKKKEEEIQVLRDRNDILQRRVKIMFDYNTTAANFQINCKDEDFECKCGGAQLSYTKKIWEQRAKNNSQGAQNNQTEQKSNGAKNQNSQAVQQRLALIEQQKQNLITRNTLLLQKISKMNSQYKLTEQMVLKSNVYLILKQQCQSLLDYISQLLSKLKKQQDYLNMIERARDEQLKEIKKKFEKVKIGDEKSNGNTSAHFNNPVDLFKTEIANLIKQYILAFQDLSKKHLRSQQVLKNYKDKLDQLKKHNEQLNKKVGDLQAKQLSKTDGIQFKYEKYKQIETTVHGLLQKEIPKLIPLWQQFIVHVKSRDKKISNLQSCARKRDKQLAQKTQIQELMRADATQIERVYKQNKQKLTKTQQFIKKVQAELTRLAAQIYRLQNQFEDEKSVLNMRLKAQTDARNKLEQKMLMVSKIQEQFNEVRDNQVRIQKDYQIWLESQKKLVEENKRDISEKEIIIKNINDENAQKQRQLQKLQNEKQTLRSEIRQLKTRLDNLNSSAENELLRMELQEYKGKIMCSCTGDRQREVVLKTCPHLFCKRCIDDTTINRNRKCPLCGIRFTKTDIHQIKWN